MMEHKQHFSTEDSKNRLRFEITNFLGMPDARCDLRPEFRDFLIHDGIIIEKWIWSSEQGSKVTSVLYKPETPRGLLPAIVITNGHGGSKNSLYSLYTAQLYAKMGIACLLYDTIGEEERHISGMTGTRAHDDINADRLAHDGGRLMMGKMVYDTIRAIDFLVTRDEIDKSKIGIAGNSLGGAVAEWTAAIDTRLCMAIVSGFGLGEYNSKYGKHCTRVPSEMLKDVCDIKGLLSLYMPHCAMLFMNGEKDYVMDTEGNGEFCNLIREHVGELERMYQLAGLPVKAAAWFDREGGHRAYHNHKDALLWINRYLGTPEYSAEQIAELPEITLGEWCDKFGLDWEPQSAGLYWTEINHRGAVYPDIGISPVEMSKLKCLNVDELGNAAYTLEGWLELIRK